MTSEIVLHTYQERRREWPFDVLATCFNKVLIPSAGSRKDEFEKVAATIFGE